MCLMVSSTEVLVRCCGEVWFVPETSQTSPAVPGRISDVSGTMMWESSVLLVCITNLFLCMCSLELMY